jgi:FlaA1/EpsC-like NDP-sugar epimerase
LLGRKDYEIRVTDIRPGEKLHEAMVSDTEERMPTQNKDIFLVKQTQQYEVLDINKLLNITPKQSPKEIKAILEGFI